MPWHETPITCDKIKTRILLSEFLFLPRCPPTHISDHTPYPAAAAAAATAAAAAAKSLQSCLILCDPIDGSLPGSAVPGILQARTLEWVAISFSNA